MTPVFSRSAMLAALGATVAAPAIAAAQTPARLRLARVAADPIAPALYAAQNGLFAKNGLAVDITSEPSGAAIAAGIASGTFQCANASLVSLIVARAKEIPFVLVAAGHAVIAGAPDRALLVAAHRSITTAAGLNGKTIAVTAPNDIDTLAVKAWMDASGGTSSTINLVTMPAAAMPAAIVAGRVDAGMLGAPVLQRALDGRTVRVLAHPTDAIAPRFLESGWFAVEAWAEAHAAQTSSFARAMRDASIAVNGRKAPTAGARATYGTALDPALIQPVIDACAKYMLIDALFDAQALILGS